MTRWNRDITYDLQAAAEAATDRITEQQDRIKELESDLKSANAEIDALSFKIENANSEIDALLKDLALMDALLKDLKKEHAGG